MCNYKLEHTFRRSCFTENCMQGWIGWSWLAKNYCMYFFLSCYCYMWYYFNKKDITRVINWRILCYLWSDLKIVNTNSKIVINMMKNLISLWVHSISFDFSTSQQFCVIKKMKRLSLSFILLKCKIYSTWQFAILLGHDSRLA